MPTRSPGRWPRRLQHELARLRDAGAEADGEVVDPLRINAIKLASREEIDEIIVSTLPRRLSRWMAMDLPHRVRRANLPLTHISGPAGLAPEAHGRSSSRRILRRARLRVLERP